MPDGVVERAEQRTIAYSSDVVTTEEARSTSAPPAPAAAPDSTGSAEDPEPTTESWVVIGDEPPTPSQPEPTTTTTTTPPTTTTTTTTTPTPTTTTTAESNQQAQATVVPAAASQPVVLAQQAPQGESDTSATETDAKVLTALLAVGSVVDRGAVLYSVEDEAAVTLIGSIPAWRSLGTGVFDGADVRQLEENLVALGYGGGVTVDDSFTSSTATAIEAWETAVGRQDPDGAVEVGDVVYFSGAGKVLRHEAVVGAAVEPGDSLLMVGSQEQAVVATIDADDAGAWVSGSSVDLAWADGTTSTGTVHGTSRDVVDDAVELVVALGENQDPPAGAEAQVSIVNARRDGVIAVPVAAIVAGNTGGRAVRVATSKDDLRAVAVTTGVVTDGWIEILRGLSVGDKVALPG